MLYFLLSTLVLTLYIDVVLSLSINMLQNKFDIPIKFSLRYDALYNGDALHQLLRHAYVAGHTNNLRHYI